MTIDLITKKKNEWLNGMEKNGCNCFNILLCPEDLCDVMFADSDLHDNYAIKISFINIMRKIF